MKVGILTFHEGLNHGAYLQAYATMRILQQLGHEAIIINYKNRAHWWDEDVRPWLAYRRPVRFIDRFHKQRAFKKDHKRFNQTRFTKRPEEVRRLHFDAVVVGSDVVWNYKVFGFDDLFFGNLPASRIISYAPSFGWVNHGDTHPEGVMEGIQKFDAISVRDENTRKIVESITGESPPIVLDPTLIYDFADDAVVTERIRKLDRYIMVYAYVTDPEVIAAVRNYAIAHDLEIISVGYRQFWCDKAFMDVGPMEWLGFYQYAAAVATSTFHGTIFSLKYEKEFLYIKHEKAYNRVASLAEICGLTAAFFASEDRVVLISPDYDSVESILAPKISFSKNWIASALN